METLQFRININAPVEKVWDTMLGDATYRQWTSAFNEGSYYKGSWEQGSKILFLDLSGEGMVAKIVANRPHEFISIETIGFLMGGKEDTESPGAKSMAGGHENYTFTETDGVTELVVDMDTSDEYKAMFEENWPKALAKLKALCEE